ncbi:MAG TPA: FkbM family methyltransferase [Candidatus Binatus sp.]|nr:FkbM family methyltransferase [Candidatus Binatus sp.]
MIMQMLCRFAPRRHRVYRLISRLASQRYQVYRVEGGLIYLNLHEHPMMVQVAMGTYEAAKQAMIRRRLRPGMTFIDVGANVGFFTLQAAQLVGNSGRVISIEPAPQNYEYLNRSIQLNGYANTRALPIALSDRDGTANLQILPLSTAHTFTQLKPQYSNLPKVTVPTKTLDAVVAEEKLERVDMVKIDVQEWEIEVLRGSIETLQSNPQLVMFLDLPKRLEMRRAIAEILAPFGYTYFPECDENTPTREIPPAGFEIAAMRI